MDYHHHEAERKPQPRRRGGKDNPPPGGPRRGHVTDSVPSADVRRAIYDGRDRCGSYARVGESWQAFDRRNRSLGLFSTERECLAAIETGAKS
jgi:hypothetical protein